MARDVLAQLNPFHVATTYWRRYFGLNLNEITPLLFVGGEFRAAQWPEIHALGVRAVLSMQAERIDEFVEPLPERVLRVPVPDFHAPTLEQLAEAVAFVEQAWRAELPVLVHCHAGVGRAPLTAAAALVSSGMQLDAALGLIVARRPIVRLMGEQRRRLDEWARLGR
jgi:predicted protein tyrosine phosphatase